MTKIDQEINLKGEVCPYTFVKTKLALEMMELGEILRVVVDHLPAVENVPRSVANEGHEVLNVGQVNDTDWEIVIRKAG
ncbi:MAG: sulfurtransferase TusA family protein [Anaerolineae bacterium]